MPKKKILLLSDDLRMTSGISTMSREIVMGTLDRYDWVQLAAGINHPEAGKIVDCNDDVRKRTGVPDARVKLYPYNSYGDIFFLRKLLKDENPDAILFFTDPHYWSWLFDNEHEIRQQVPMLYYHIWDNIPDPIYNRDFYESCDWIGCISKLTYGIVNRVGKLTNNLSWKPLEDWQISYVPHGINEDTFKPLDTINNDIKKDIYTKDYEFILFFNNRNIRRKQPADVIYSYKLFCDMIGSEKASKCLLLMHTQVSDMNGTDLAAVKKAICPDYDIKYVGKKIEAAALNELYNIADCTINIANNEGFGLATAESIMAGTPIIVNVTGGLQDQCGFNFYPDDYISIGSLHNREKSKHLVLEGEWAFPIWPSTININGSPQTPYIFDDRVNDEEVAKTIKQIYDMGRKERKLRGLAGREWAIKNLSAKLMCDLMTDGIDTTIKNFKPKERYNIYKVI
jgi:glycosyltransferase involved in cell wall biosynthesis